MKYSDPYIQNLNDARRANAISYTGTHKISPLAASDTMFTKESIKEQGLEVWHQGSTQLHQDALHRALSICSVSEKFRKDARQALQEARSLPPAIKVEVKNGRIVIAPIRQKGRKSP